MIQHLAVIMDGNRRWAYKNKLSLAIGYKEGGKRALQEVMQFCIQKSIQYLSLYTFSLENFYRSQEEKEIVFSMLLKEIHAQKEMLIEEEISIRFVGKLELLPPDVLSSCRDLEKITQNGKRLQVALLICYGGQQEIIASIKKIVADGSINAQSSEQEIQKQFESALWSYPFPFPDLIIRTGGVKRLSNFLTYQSIYSELVFLDILWPEITKEDCQYAYDIFKSTKRNFGR